MWLLHTVYQTNPGLPMHLPQGSARLDVAGYDRHVDEYYQNDRREYIQAYHLKCSQAIRTTTYRIYAITT